MKLTRFKVIVFFIVFLSVLTFFLLKDIPHMSDAFRHEDKIQHFLAFFMLCFLALIISPRRFFVIFVLLSLYGGVIEILQGYLTLTHVPSFNDWIADTLGVITMYGIYLFNKQKFILFAEKLRNH